ncbi:MAG: alpha/beta fold hydrolase [Parvibaculum sp.]
MRVKANNIEVEVVTHGDAGSPAILLVNGYTSQLINWPKPFIDGLVSAGFQVVTYDNRDVGLSQKFSGTPDPRATFKAVMEGRAPDIPYTLADMAADGIGVLDALGIERAHVLGVSMGGMIVQLMGINHGERLLSLTSVMSSTGNPDVPPATAEAQKALNEPAPSQERGDVIAHSTKGRRTYESPAYRKSDAEYAALIGEAYDRMFYPQGYMRQYCAIVADGSRVERLKSVTVPTLVIHGKDDNLVRVEGGIDTAKSIPGARLELIDGMGHDLPEGLCDRLLALVIGHARGALVAAAD